MSQFKDFVFLVMYICCLINIAGKVDCAVYYSILVISFIFFVKYLNIKNKIRFSGRVLKQYLINQRETFINALNHDLRIPVIAQLRVLELINKDKTNTDNNLNKDMLYQAELSCRGILNLISLLINVYNTENGNRKLTYGKFNLSDIIYSCINELEYEAGEKNIRFDYECNIRNLLIYADKEEIKNVVLNILLSSVINSELNCAIKIKAELINNKIRLTVTGKNKNNYSGANTSYAAIGQSTRIYFCKKILELHNGKLLFDNKLPNSFIFELPHKNKNLVYA